MYVTPTYNFVLVSASPQFTLTSPDSGYYLSRLSKFDMSYFNGMGRWAQDLGSWIWGKTLWCDMHVGVQISIYWNVDLKGMVQYGSRNLVMLECGT